MSIGLIAYEMEVLTVLYHRFFESEYFFDLKEWCAERSMEYAETHRFYDRITDDLKIAQPSGPGMNIHVSLGGILAFEESDTEPEFVHRQLVVRRAFLLGGLKAREQNGRHSRFRWRDVMWDSGLYEEPDWYPNLKILDDQGLVEVKMNQTYQLTDYGIKRARAIRESMGFAERWESMKTVDSKIRGQAQKRGHDLEDLIAEVVRAEGFEAVTKARAASEENDIVMTSGLTHILVSCKWEARPAKSEYVQLLRVRMDKRKPIYGALISAGGFSRDAVKEAESHTSQGLVVLIGTGDLDRLFRSEISFVDLFQDRHRTLVQSGKAKFEN